MSDLRFIRVEWDSEIAVVIIDRQDKHNALNADVIAELDQVFTALQGDDKVRGILLTGAGEKAFVAGADIGELAKMDSLSGVRVSGRGWIRTGRRVRVSAGLPSAHRQRQRAVRTPGSRARDHPRVRRHRAPCTARWPGARPGADAHR